MHILAKKTFTDSGDRARRREILQEPLQPLLAKTMRDPRLCFLPERTRLRQPLLSLWGESDLPLAAIRADLDLNELLLGESMQLPKPSSVGKP
jgi:hypothetical protein